VLIEFLREGKVEEAVRAFKKIYLEVVRQMIDYLDAQGSGGLGKEGGKRLEKKH
jgi:hypothetical protein